MEEWKSRRGGREGRREIERERERERYRCCVASLKTEDRAMSQGTQKAFRGYK
jgi:hypothetical protein